MGAQRYNAAPPPSFFVFVDSVSFFGYRLLDIEKHANIGVTVTWAGKRRVPTFPSPLKPTPSSVASFVPPDTHIMDRVLTETEVY